MPRLTRSKRLVIPQGATVDVPAKHESVGALNDARTHPPEAPADSAPSTDWPYDRLFAEPGELLYWLGTSVSGLRVTAKNYIMQLSPIGTTLEDFLPDFMRREWQALGVDGAERVRWLDQALQLERSLMAIELIAVALGVQGEDGLVCLLDLLGHQDFAVRHKAAIGLGVAGRAARWTVPSIERHLQREPAGMVFMSLLVALTKIGGPRAERLVEMRRFALHPLYQPYVEEAVDRAARHTTE